MYPIFKNRKSVIRGVSAKPEARETLPKGGGGAKPPNFCRVSRALGAAQTSKMTDFRSKTNVNFYMPPKRNHGYVWVFEGSLAGISWVGFRSMFGQTWPPNPSRTTGLVLQCRLHFSPASPARAGRLWLCKHRVQDPHSG